MRRTSKVLMAVGLPRSLEKGRPDGHPRLRLRPRSLRHISWLYAAKHHFLRDALPSTSWTATPATTAKPSATNFNPEINIREITQKGEILAGREMGRDRESEIHRPLTYPNIGPRESYLLYHEELPRASCRISTPRRARFWMTFGQEYLTHLRVIQDIGMARIDPVMWPNGRKSCPSSSLQGCPSRPRLTPERITPARHRSAAASSGLDKEGHPSTYYIYNNCSHEAAYKETGAQAVSYTTGVPAMVGAMMFLTGKWVKPGVHNVEEFDPDPFLETLAGNGLPWTVETDGDIEFTEDP